LPNPVAMKKALLLFCFQEANDLPGGLAVRFVLVLFFRGAPFELERAAFLFDPGRFQGKVPAGTAADLADAGREVTETLKIFRQQVHAGQEFARGRAVQKDARRVRPPPAEQRSSRRIAQRILTIGTLKAHAAGGQAIEVGSFDERMPIAAEHGVEVVDRNEEDVELARLFLGVGRRGASPKGRQER
jgi:hypothetical protein